MFSPLHGLKIRRSGLRFPVLAMCRSVGQTLYSTLNSYFLNFLVHNLHTTSLPQLDITTLLLTQAQPLPNAVHIGILVDRRTSPQHHRTSPRRHRTSPRHHRTSPQRHRTSLTHRRTSLRRRHMTRITGRVFHIMTLCIIKD